MFLFSCNRLKNGDVLWDNLYVHCTILTLFHSLTSVPVNPNSTCDCITHALWQRNLEWTSSEMGENDLMMISESDVLITSDKVMEPLAGDFRAWVYWAETGLYGGQTFAMSFTTLSKKDWRLLLNNSQV